MKSALLFLVYLLLLNTFCRCATCPEQWHALMITTSGTHSSRKCVRYFDNPVNFSEAQYVCNEIYDGDLLSIGSPAEQKLLIQYLHGLLGFKRQPVCWLGGTFTYLTKNTPASASTVSLSSQLKWVDGTQAQYHNFAFDPLTAASTSERRCVKILSITAKGEQGSPGQWSPEDCKLRDAGFVCQKLIPIRSRSAISDNVVDRSRISDPSSYLDTGAESSSSSSSPVRDRAGTLLAQFGEQLNAIKELCESQIKAIERLSSNFLFILQNFDDKHKKDEL